MRRLRSVKSTVDQPLHNSQKSAKTGPITLSTTVIMGALVCLVATRCYGAAGFLTKRWVADKAGLDAKLVAFGSQIGATDLPRPSLRRAVWRDVSR